MRFLVSLVLTVVVLFAFALPLFALPLFALHSLCATFKWGHAEKPTIQYPAVCADCDSIQHGFERAFPWLA